MRVKRPNPGERRIVERFLLLPRELPCRDATGRSRMEWRWLERAFIEQSFCTFWTDIRFVDASQMASVSDSKEVS